MRKVATATISSEACTCTQALRTICSSRVCVPASGRHASTQAPQADHAHKQPLNTRFGGGRS
eukprot:1158067-Pelagomonas_calceolata.AAC.1